MNWNHLITMSDDAVYDALCLWQNRDIARLTEEFPSLVMRADPNAPIPASVLRRMAVHTAILYKHEVDRKPLDGLAGLLRSVLQPPPMGKTADNPALAAHSDWSNVLRLIFPRDALGAIHYTDFTGDDEMKASFAAMDAQRRVEDALGMNAFTIDEMPEEIIAQLVGRPVSCGITVMHGGDRMVVTQVMLMTKDEEDELVDVCATLPFNPAEHWLADLQLIPAHYIDLTR